jgi:hypothetical protein
MRKITHFSPGSSTGPFISTSSGEMGNLADTPAYFCKVSWTQGTKVIPEYKTGKHVGLERNFVVCIQLLAHPPVGKQEI